MLVKVKGHVFRVPILTMITILILLEGHYVCIVRDYFNPFDSSVNDFHFILRHFHPNSDI
jgi:hypothetical protein